MRVLLGQDVLIPQLMQPAPLPGREGCGDEFIIPARPAATWQELIEKCPPGWKPDVYIHWSPEYNAIPFGIENAECPTIAVLGDWNLGAGAMHAAAGAFDVIFADERGAQVLRNAGFTNTRYTLIWGHELHLHYRLPDIERDIDILMLGNFNHQVQWERENWLARVAKLSGKYRVVLSSNVHGDEYTRLMNRARIVFNRSVGGGINMRTYEAPACGALLFQERENIEIGALFQDRSECVLYGDDDLEALLDYYLAPENAMERERIAENGYRKVQGHDRLRHFGEFLGQIENCIQEQRQSNGPGARAFAHLPAIECRRRIASQWLLALQPDTLPQLSGELNCLSQHANAVGEPGASGETAVVDAAAKWTIAEVTNLKAVFMGEWALRSEAHERERALEEAVRHGNCAVQLAPNFVTAYCNLGWFFTEMKRDQEAAGAFQQAIRLLESPEISTSQMRSVFFPRDYKFFNVMHEKLLCEHPPGSDEWLKDLRTLLLGCLNGKLAELAFRRGNMTQAAHCSEQAVGYTPNAARFHYGLGAAYQRLGRAEDALRAFDRARTLSPFLFEAWLDEAKLSLAMHRPGRAARLMDELAAIIAGCPLYAGAGPIVEQIRQESYRAAEAASSTPEMPLRLLALPDWNKAEEWQPLIREYVQSYRSDDPVKLFLPVEAGLHPTVEQITARLERFLRDELNIGTDAIPDVVLLTESLSTMSRTDRRLLAHAVVRVSEDTASPSDFAGLPQVEVGQIYRALSRLRHSREEPVLV